MILASAHVGNHNAQYLDIRGRSPVEDSHPTLHSVNPTAPIEQRPTRHNLAGEGNDDHANGHCRDGQSGFQYGPRAMPHGVLDQGLMREFD